jgi:hypothetical protein
MLAKFIITISQGIFVRTRGVLVACYRRRSGVSAGLLLLTLARVVCKLNFLSLLATVRGKTIVYWDAAASIFALNSTSYVLRCAPQFYAIHRKFYPNFALTG